jgi:integrase
VPRGTTVADLIDKYSETVAKLPGRTKAATLAMLKREIGRTPLASLSAVTLRDLIDRRVQQGAGGVTIAADLSFLSAVLKWGRHARHLDIPKRLTVEARAGLKHRGLSTRGTERSREPTDAELERPYAYWRTNLQQRIDMVTLCRFALASGMRQEEICKLQVDDVDRGARTVIIRDRKDQRNEAGNNQTVPLLPEAWAIIEPQLSGRTGCFVFDARAASVSLSRRPSRGHVRRSASPTCTSTICRPGDGRVFPHGPRHSARRAADWTQDLGDAAPLNRHQARGSAHRCGVARRCQRRRSHIDVGECHPSRREVRRLGATRELVATFTTPLGSPRRASLTREDSGSNWPTSWGTRRSRVNSSDPGFTAAVSSPKRNAWSMN